MSRTTQELRIYGLERALLDYVETFGLRDSARKALMLSEQKQSALSTVPKFTLLKTLEHLKFFKK